MKKLELFYKLKKKFPSIIFKNQNFLKIWVSQILSQWSLNIINLVLINRIWEQTGSTIAVSLIWVFYGLPALILGPFSGFFVDIFNKRKVLLYTNLLEGIFVLLYLPFRFKIYPLYSIVFLYSAVSQFYMPAEGATLLKVVKKKDLPAANGLFLFTAQSAIVLGLGLGGIFLRVIGQEGSFWLGSSMLFSAALMAYYLPDDRPSGVSFEASFTRFWTQIKKGYLFIKRTPLIFLPLLLILFFQVFLVILVAILPSFASEVLKIDLRDAAPLLIVPTGLGCLAGTLFLPYFLIRTRKKKMVEVGLVLWGLVLSLIGSLLARLGSFRVVIAPLMMFLLGLAAIFAIIPCQTLIQEKTPPFLRGRVFGALGFLNTLVSLPALILAATVVDLLGVTHLITLVGIVIILIFCYIHFWGNYALLANNRS